VKKRNVAHDTVIFLTLSTEQNCCQMLKTYQLILRDTNIIRVRL